jgi:hypothetical protein
MESYQTAIPAELVKLPDLDALVQQLGKAYGAKAKVTVQYMIETDDVSLSEAFDNLAFNFTSRKPIKLEGKERKRAKRGTKTPKKEKSAEGDSSRSYKDAATGKFISARALKTALKDGEISDNTVFVKPDGRRFVALGGKLIREP